MNVAAAVTAAAPVLTPIEIFANVFNNNPYFIGFMMLFLNLGGRFMVLEVTKGQEKFFQNPWVRRFLIFTVLFVGTRNLVVAAIMTLVIVLFIGYLFNENSSLCLFVNGGKGSCKSPDGEKPKETLTVEEMEILNRLSSKAQKFAQADEKKDGGPPDLGTRVYGTNLNILQGLV